MPQVTIDLTAQEIARLSEAWSEEGVPLVDSVKKALAQATKLKIRRERQEAEATSYVTTSAATDAVEDAEFDNW